MRKFKRFLARVLLVSIVGGVLSPTLTVFAASVTGFDLVSNKDTAGTVTISDVTYPFYNSNNVNPADNLSFGDGYSATGTPLEYAEQILNNYTDIQTVGVSSGCIANYKFRFATSTYALMQLNSYTSNPADFQTPYEPEAWFTFKVGDDDYKVNEKTTTYKDWLKKQNSVAFTDLGLDDSDTYLKLWNYACTDCVGIDSSTQQSPEDLGFVTYAAVNNCIAEFYVYATKYRHAIYGSGKDGAPYQEDNDVKDTLAELNEIQMKFTALYPILGDLWLYNPKGNEMSLKDMYDESAESYTPKSPSIQLDSSFDKVLDDRTPLGLFYIINTENGIARIDREKVWNSREIDTLAGDLVQQWFDDRNGVDDGVNKWLEPIKEGEETLSSGAPASNWVASSVTGVDGEGTAVNQNAVTLTDNIVQGLTYSATFVPMKTNLYSPDTLAQFDEEWREDFYYKYGFMRKALLWDKSGSSVMDFYNANGKCTSTLTVVTLRDLLESEGNDIALYVDGDFYNAAEAIEEGNALLDIRAQSNEGLAQDLLDYVNTLEVLNELMKEDDITLSTVLSAIVPPLGIANMVSKMYKKFTNADDIADLQQSLSEYALEIKNKYNFDATTVQIEDMKEFAGQLTNANNYSSKTSLDNHVLKTGDFSQYSNKTEALLKQCDEFNYRKIEETEPVNNDNRDTIVLPSSLITSYMDAMSSYENRIKKDEEGVVVVNRYTSYDDYTPMLSLSYVSSLYREGNYYSLANLVANDNPVFLASDDICGIEDAGQWYCNTILNYALLQNLKSATQVDYTYTVDLDCPLYIDVFGNILTESGIVVIPAAANATLHTADFKDSNVAVGLYSVYGKDYFVPVECTGAAKAMFPFFALDKEEGVYIINGSAVTVGTDSVQYNALSPYDVSTQSAVTAAYRSYIQDGANTNLNWIALVNVCNEVMRGAPIENIDKEEEALDVVVEKNKAAVVAAVKLEALINSFEGAMDNTLLSIPDFTRMDSTEYLVAFLIKMLIVATTAVVIIGVYRDGVSGTLGLRTLWKSLSSIALTFAAVCVIPAVFQLTYYAANKFLLQNEAMRILMLNQEKYQSGVEIGMLETYTPEDTSDMSLQLDWISVPWYNQLENMLYGSTLKNLDSVKREAYHQSPIYDHYDVVTHDDGVYVTVQSLFEGVNIDYTFNDISQTVDEESENASINGLYLYSTNKVQTAGFYSPYYAFLTALVGNVNEYNYYHSSYNYTTKYMSGNRLKTVGLCNDYFTSKSFMELDGDIMHIYEIYDDPRVNTYDHGYLFTEEDKALFEQSYWYNTIDEEHLTKRVDLINAYARDFIANNKDLLMKVSDETFLKVMALNMAIKYNQLFGIPSANALDIYNMDSNDLLRISIVKTDEAILSSPMSYSRYVYNFGGEPAIYAAAVLTVIMWVGSFIKPLCTVIVFISVFLSIWVFRVVLRKPSANLWGYFITVMLLCVTNVLHAIIIKISTYLPNLGLSTLGCLIFIIVGQVIYLLLLGYVTGVSLKDWSNLGFAEYDREAQRIKRKFGSKRLAQDTLSGRVPRHDNNWDYYNDLVEQHRSRNA